MLDGLIRLFVNRPPKYPRKRHRDWPKVRAEHLKTHPQCMVCGTKKKLNVHHIIPYHERPDLELARSNFYTLCESSDGGCHFLFGHLLNWKAWNPRIAQDAYEMRQKIKNRTMKGANP